MFYSVRIVNVLVMRGQKTKKVFDSRITKDLNSKNVCYILGS